ncbi:hypothetical protein T10_6246 [Trichinella papuae]|uniref:Uncharacterized protein n=1 Tax=Trichinella papuae TaxID=268474 RepID=A0A0V1N100_9BILA|nr:hypothetical protein T10_6246 [Trichinella papuae]
MLLAQEQIRSLRAQKTPKVEINLARVLVKDRKRRLLEFRLPKFGGDVVELPRFWEQFSSSMDRRTDLDSSNRKRTSSRHRTTDREDGSGWIC